MGTFARRGYYGTTTSEVARRAGISQAYVYRLFPDKQTLFIAVVEHSFGRIRAVFDAGAARCDGGTPQEVLGALSAAYADLIADRDVLLMQLHAQCAAVSEPAFRSVVRAGYAELVEHVQELSGATDNDVQQFFTRGAMCHLVVAVDAIDDDTPWARLLADGFTH